MDAKKFLEIWSNLALHVKTLRIVVVGEFVIILLLSMTLLRKVTERPPIIVVPGALQKMVLKPGNLPESVIKDFALSILYLYSSFQPHSVQGQLEEILKYVPPAAYNQVRTEFATQIKKIIESNYAQQFNPTQATLYKTDDGYVVSVEGRYRRIVGDRVVAKGGAKYEITLQNGIPTEQNPYGLWLVGIHYEYNPDHNRAPGTGE